MEYRLQRVVIFVEFIIFNVILLGKSFVKCDTHVVANAGTVLGINSVFTVNKCCENDNCSGEDTLNHQIFSLPPQLFRIKDHTGTLAVRTNFDPRSEYRK
jgi:hypothetical protein